MTTPTVEAVPEPKRRATRWLRWALVASLAFNLLIVGVMAGKALHGRHGDPMAGAGGGMNLLAFARQLPLERRKEVWSVVGTDWETLRPLRAEVRQARSSAREALLAEPFDPARFTEAQTRLLEAEVKARTAMQRLFSAVAGKLSHEERQMFARRMGPEGPSKGPRGSGRRDGGGLDPMSERPDIPPKR